MKRYSFVAPAGVPVEFDHPGRFFSLLNCITPIDVSLQQGGAMPEVLEYIDAGFWTEFETPFTRIRVVSPIDQTIAFVVGMERAGKAKPASSMLVVLDLANLAASAFAQSEYVDLGDSWADATVGAIFMGTTSPGQFLQVQCNGIHSASRPAIGRSWNGAAQTSTSASVVPLSGLMPTDRRVRVSFSNGSTPQGASSYALLIIDKP